MLKIYLSTCQNVHDYENMFTDCNDYNTTP